MIMKKTTKIWGITALTLCITGGMIYAVGSAAGGKEAMQKFSPHRFTYSQEKQKLDTSSKLQIDFTNMDLQIQPSKDENWYLSYTIDSTKKNNPLSMETENDTLHLSEKNAEATMYYEEGNLFGISKRVSYNSVACLYVPKGQPLDTCIIRLGRGDLLVDGVNTKQMEIHMEEGDADIQTSQTEDFSISMEEGDLSTSNALWKTADILTAVGDISLSVNNEIAKDMQVSAKTIYGDVNTSSVFAKTKYKTDEDDCTIYEKSGTGNTTRILSQYGDISLQ